MKNELDQGLHAILQAAHHTQAAELQAVGSAIASALQGTETPQAEATLENIEVAAEHATNAHALLAKGLGELASYASQVLMQKPYQEKIVPVSSPPPIRKENRGNVLLTSENPTLVLDFSLEELEDVMVQLPKLEKIHHGTTAIYNIPGHPDKLLRAGKISTYTRSRSYNTQQNREHMRLYEAELERLRTAGIAVLPHVSHITGSNIDSQAILYTVVARHPRPLQLHKYTGATSDIEREAVSLDTVEKLARYYTDPDREVSDPTAVPIWDLTIDQFTEDGTMLDIDPFLCVRPCDLEDCLSELSWWRKNIPVTPQSRERHRQIQATIGKAYSKARSRRLAAQASRTSS